MAATNAVSWRSEGIKHRKNEIFLDVVERLNLLVAANGTLLRSEVHAPRPAPPPPPPPPPPLRRPPPPPPHLKLRRRLTLPPLLLVQILGSLKMRSYLSGMPELKLGLNDKLLFEATGRRAGGRGLSNFWLNVLSTLV